MVEGLPHASAGLRIAEAPRRSMFVLRGRAAAIEAALAAAGATRGDALHLGPDEWWLLAGPEDRQDMIGALERGLAGRPHSLVGVSDRMVALRIEGARATEALAAFCPLDLDLAVFQPGRCTRTLLGKADMMLWRLGADTFHLEVGRSFTGYAAGLLLTEA